MDNGRVAFITSAAKGLGHATVKALLEAGWDVFFTYGKSQAQALRLEEDARRLSRRAVAWHADLLDKSSTLAAVQECLRTYRRIDAFIHNFGPFVFERTSLSEYSDEMWNHMLEGNLSNFFWIYRDVISGMRERSFGRIITIGYDGAANAAGWKYRAAYAASKSALASLTRSIAREERIYQITANMVCPGDIRGDAKMKMISDVVDSVDSQGIRPAVGGDVARAIVFLCSEDSIQVNGTVLEVTGGHDTLRSGL